MRYRGGFKCRVYEIHVSFFLSFLYKQMMHNFFSEIVRETFVDKKRADYRRYLSHVIISR